MTFDLYLNILLMAMALTATASAWSLMRLVRGRASRWMNAVCAACSVLGTCLLAVELITFGQFSLTGIWPFAITFGSILLVVAMSGLAVADFRSRQLSHRRWNQPIVWILFVVSMGMSVLSWERFDRRTSYSNEFAINVFPVGEVIKDYRRVGKTDEGRNVDLYRFHAEEKALEEFLSGAEERFASFGATMIRRQAANTHSNCHGWVFAAGRYLLTGSDVEVILQDNGYLQTLEPKEGAVIVYRSQSGQILHTGLVQAILSDGTILIESKWAVDQRYLHKPEDQPFSTLYEFYETDRADHCIMISRRREPIVLIDGSLDSNPHSS